MFNSPTLAPKIKRVSVEYTAKGSRVVKDFSDNFAARRFYIRKSREGADPKIVSASLS